MKYSETIMHKCNHLQMQKCNIRTHNTTAHTIYYTLGQTLTCQQLLASISLAYCAQYRNQSFYVPLQAQRLCRLEHVLLAAPRACIDANFSPHRNNIAITILPCHASSKTLIGVAMFWKFPIIMLRGYHTNEHHNTAHIVLIKMLCNIYLL